MNGLARALVCWLAVLVMPAWAARGDPVVIDSPSWQALMARPASDNGVTAFYAADLLELWGRGAEGQRLRRALLLRHLRALAGDSPPEATLGQLWAAGPVSADEVAAAHQRARGLAPGAAWAATRPVDDDAARQLAERLGNRPPLDLKAFVERWGDCVPQGTCAPRASQRASRPKQTDAEREQARRQSESEQRSRRRRAERLQNAAMVAYVLGTLALHLLLTRVLGRWGAFVVTLFIGAGLGLWLVLATAPNTGWGGLGIVLVALGLAGSGLMLAPLYDAIYTRWFKRR
jgi:hypothetical protein